MEETQILEEEKRAELVTLQGRSVNEHDEANLNPELRTRNRQFRDASQNTSRMMLNEIQNAPEAYNTISNSIYSINREVPLLHNNDCNNEVTSGSSTSCSHQMENSFLSRPRSMFINSYQNNDEIQIEPSINGKNFDINHLPANDYKTGIVIRTHNGPTINGSPRKHELTSNGNNNFLPDDTPSNRQKISTLSAPGGTCESGNYSKNEPTVHCKSYRAEFHV